MFDLKKSLLTTYRWHLYLLISLGWKWYFSFFRSPLVIYVKRLESLLDILWISPHHMSCIVSHASQNEWLQFGSEIMRWDQCDVCDYGALKRLKHWILYGQKLSCNFWVIILCIKISLVWKGSLCSDDVLFKMLFKWGYLMGTIKWCS